MGREVHRVPMGWKPEDEYGHILDPPSGDAWQMWSTTSDRPMSPTFETPEELAHWLATTGASWFADEVASYDKWFRLITGPGWAPSAAAIIYRDESSMDDDAVSGGKLITGSDYAISDMVGSDEDKNSE